MTPPVLEGSHCFFQYSRVGPERCDFAEKQFFLLAATARRLDRLKGRWDRWLRYALINVDQG